MNLTKKQNGGGRLIICSYRDWGQLWSQGVLFLGRKKCDPETTSSQKHFYSCLCLWVLLALNWFCSQQSLLQVFPDWHSFPPWQWFSHSITNQAWPCSASKIRRDRVRSGWHTCRQDNGSQPGVTLSPWGYVAMSGDIFGWYSWGEGAWCFWCLAGRDQEHTEQTGLHDSCSD